MTDPAAVEMVWEDKTLGSGQRCANGYDVGQTQDLASCKGLCLKTTAVLDASTCAAISWDNTTHDCIVCTDLAGFDWQSAGWTVYARPGSLKSPPYPLVALLYR